MDIVNWQNLLNGLVGSSPLAAGLGFACYKLWVKTVEQDKQIQELNSQHLEFLKSLLKKNE